MPRFNKNSTKELKEFLYNSFDHDANLENVKYDIGEDSIKIELYNPIFEVKIDLTFYNIGIALAVKGEWTGSRETVISLTVEEDYSYLQTYIPEYSKYVGDAIYLLCQMFSGDELHIVSKEVVVEIVKDRKIKNGTGDGLREPF